ncbi:MAG: DNA repair exonuclease [Planctomycetales bacterium]|nr:DNA repair exonuclease [Planctomycetales bacterium]
MTDFSFIHAADVHLDSPLASLRRLDGNAAERIERASRRSVELLINAALEHEVSAVLIAGDVFHGPVKDAGAGLWLERQLRQLTRAGISVFLIRGNHDFVSPSARISTWPSGVYQFSTEQPETRILDNVGMAVHGQSFAAREQSSDLASNYPAPIPGYFNVGLLHTSLAGSPMHDTYAPTSVEILENKGYDYWALGHIHLRSSTSLSTKCYIGYSGCMQGRHIREIGPKGCNLVQVSGGSISHVRFVPTDSLRWYELSVDISAAQQLLDVEDLVIEQLRTQCLDADGRPLAVRVNLTGPTLLHADLTRSQIQTKLAEILCQSLLEHADIWLESMRIGTSLPNSAEPADFDLPLKYLSMVADEIREDPVLQKELQGTLDELYRKTQSELNEIQWPPVMESTRNSEFKRLWNAAENLLLARIAGSRQA